MYASICTRVYTCTYVRMCLCNDDLAHVINQSAIISFFFFHFVSFHLSLAHGLSRSPNNPHDLHMYSPSLSFIFSFIFHFAPFFLFFGTRLKENNYTYISRASMYLCDSIIPSVPLSPSLFSIFRVLFPIPRFVHYVPFSLREYPFVSTSFLSYTRTHANTHTRTRTHANTRAHIQTYKHTSAHTNTVSLFFSPFLFLSCFFLSFFFLLFCLIVTEKYAVENLRAAVQNRARVFSFLLFLHAPFRREN